MIVSITAHCSLHTTSGIQITDPASRVATELAVAFLLQQNSCREDRMAESKRDRQSSTTIASSRCSLSRARPCAPPRVVCQLRIYVSPDSMLQVTE